MDNNIPQADLETIEKYLSKELSAEEEKSFEQRLPGDPALQQKVNEVRLLSVGIQEAILTETLRDFHKTLQDRKPASVIIMAKRFAVAAAIFIPLLLGVWFWGFKKNAGEKLFEAYFTPDPGLATTMGVADNYEFEKAMVDYKTGNYQLAISNWEKLRKLKPDNDTLDYFIGAALLAGKEPAKSIACFDKVIASGKKGFLNEAYWYKGLALLGEGRKEEAMIELKKTVHDQKEALIKELNK